MATDSLSLFPTPDTGPASRNSDPATSHQAALDAQGRTPSQRLRLLSAYFWAGPIGLTDEEAAEHTGIINNRRACWWRRCSELRAQGLIENNGNTRLGDAGSERVVCAITGKGYEEFNAASEKYSFS